MSIRRGEEDAMLLRAEEANRNLVRNLDYLKNLHDIKTDRELADKIGVSPSTIVSIRKEGKIPTVYPFFEGIMNWTEFTFEDLLNSELAAQEVKADADASEQDGDSSSYGGESIFAYKRIRIAGWLCRCAEMFSLHLNRLLPPRDPRCGIRPVF